MGARSPPEGNRVAVGRYGLPVVKQLAACLVVALAIADAAVARAGTRPRPAADRRRAASSRALTRRPPASRSSTSPIPIRTSRDSTTRSRSTPRPVRELKAEVPDSLSPISTGSRPRSTSTASTTPRPPSSRWTPTPPTSAVVLPRRRRATRRRPSTCRCPLEHRHVEHRHVEHRHVERRHVEHRPVEHHAHGELIVSVCVRCSTSWLAELYASSV